MAKDFCLGLSEYQIYGIIKPDDTEIHEKHCQSSQKYIPVVNGQIIQTERNRFHIYIAVAGKCRYWYTACYSWYTRYSYMIKVLKLTKRLAAAEVEYLEKNSPNRINLITYNQLDIRKSPTIQSFGDVLCTCIWWQQELT